MEKKILLTMQQSLPQLTENEATFNKNPEIIREIYLDEIKKKTLKQAPSPIGMLKRKPGSVP
jgi:hypothetical protein